MESVAGFLSWSSICRICCRSAFAVLCYLALCLQLAVFATNAVDYTTQFKFKLEADDTIIDAPNMSVGKVEISTTTKLPPVGSEDRARRESDFARRVVHVTVLTSYQGSPTVHVAMKAAEPLPRLRRIAHRRGLRRL